MRVEESYFEAHQRRVREQADAARLNGLVGLPLLAPENGTATSAAAAKAVSGKAEIDRRRVLAYLVECGPVGATREEIAHALGMDGDTVRPRVWELRDKPEVWARFGEEKPLVIELGEERLTRHGNRASVVTVTPAGYRANAHREAA